MKHIRGAAALALAGALMLAACGGDDSSTDTTVADTTAATTAPAATMAPGASDPMATGDIVAVASSNPDFSTLVKAVEAAGLVETLQGPGPFTVFAPTNEAFAALPAGVLDALLLPANKDALVKVLTYHVLPQQVMAADVTAGDVPTVEGQTIAVTTDGGVKVNGVPVIATDVAASNGVIHVIGSVLVPPDVDPSKLAS